MIRLAATVRPASLVGRLAVLLGAGPAASGGWDRVMNEAIRYWAKNSLQLSETDLPSLTYQWLTKPKFLLLFRQPDVESFVLSTFYNGDERE